MTEQIFLIVGFVLTLLVIIGYLLGDNNVLFRIASYLFVGVAAGFVFVVVVYQVLVPRLVVPLISGSISQFGLTVVPLVLSLLLLFKLSPRLSGLGSIPMGYLVGVGAAVAIGGAVLGTLLTQTRATIDLFDLASPASDGSISPALRLLDGAFVLVGTLSTLAYFHFSARARRGQTPARPAFASIFGSIGQIFIAITLGSLFAGVFTAALTALIQRLDFLWNVIRSFLS